MSLIVTFIESQGLFKDISEQCKNQIITSWMDSILFDKKHKLPFTVDYDWSVIINDADGNQVLSCDTNFAQWFIEFIPVYYLQWRKNVKQFATEQDMPNYLNEMFKNDVNKDYIHHKKS